jgi:adenylate kinase
MSTDRFKSLLLFGPPGIGKGTQGALLGAIPGFKHLATGDIFRRLDRNSALGQEFLKYSTKGLLVPDELTMRLWREYVDSLIEHDQYNPATEVLVLDGIPRSRVQAKAIIEHIDVLGIIALTCPDLDVIVKRLGRRAIQQGRPDDADEAVIRRRFGVFADQTTPVLEYFDDDLIHEINAVQRPANVLRDVLAVILPYVDGEFKDALE